MSVQFRPYRADIHLAEMHVRMALAAVIPSIGDSQPCTSAVRSARGFAQLSLKMLETARHQSMYSPTALSPVNFEALSRGQGTFARPAVPTAEDAPPW